MHKGSVFDPIFYPSFNPLLLASNLMALSAFQTLIAPSPDLSPELHTHILNSILQNSTQMSKRYLKLSMYKTVLLSITSPKPTLEVIPISANIQKKTLSYFSHILYPYLLRPIPIIKFHQLYHKNISRTESFISSSGITLSLITILSSVSLHQPNWFPCSNPTLDIVCLLNRALRKKKKKM